ncbi:MAG TPA: carboxypeptidase regulatory-like domain-containing protein [Thermoanaerobaculia bacterium]|nr:carboxypeptidase regulatory-like domain-containing protein [Thermoanaerobaculia bacterium]
MSRKWSVLVLSLLLALPAVAQTVTGTMQGTVSDRSGGVLPGVTLTIRNAETGLQRVVVTNEAGFYNAPFLPIGRYDVLAELAGFGVARRSNVRIELNETTVQDYLLDPAVTESVTVTADAPRINVSDGEIKQTIRSAEIMSLPQSNQTSFLGLASTLAGYQESNPGGSHDNPTLSVGSSANFNGAGTRGTTFQINGVNNDDSSENQHRQGVALATIASFQVLTNSYSAEFGRGYGAVVLVQTKSGTNKLSGEIYGYGQDGQWNEKKFFERTQPLPDNYRRQFGATAGFPIIRDTLFGFVHYDSTQFKGNQIVSRPLILPSDMALPRLTLGNDTPENRAFQNAILARFPTGLSPNAPLVSARAYQYPQFANNPDKDWSARLDWNAGNAHNVNTRYQHTTQLRENAELIIGEQTLQDNEQSNFGITWTNVLGSSTVQETRYGLGLRSTNVDILAGNDTPIVRFAAITPATIIGNAGAYPINRDQKDHQFVYNFSTARWADHTLKLGTDIRRSQLDDRASNNNRGFWNFTATCGGVTYPTGLHAFFAGCVSTFQKSFGPDFLENELKEENLYAQDDWRPFDNLTLNLGVRYERVAVPRERENRMNYFFGDTQYVDPRLGFAYVPDWGNVRLLRALTGSNGRFSIRGGYGHYHGRIFQSIFSQGGANVRYNPPNATFLSIPNSTNIADPTNGFVFVPGQPLTTRVTLTTIDPDLQMPETRQWNLTFERQFFRESRLRASYIGTLGKNLLQYRFDNLPVRPDGTTWRVAADWRCAGTGVVAGQAVNATCPNVVPIAANEISLRVPRTNERRPDARYNTNLVVDNVAESSYHAGQLEFETGYVGGFQGRATYTFSKALDSGSEATASGAGDINIFPEYENYKRGLSRFDTRHRFTMTGSYLLPFFRDRSDALGQILGGWQLSTVVRLSSGTPFTIIDSGAVDIDFDGVANQRPIAVDPSRRGGFHVNDPNTSQQELPVSAFRRATPEDDISDLMGRNTFYTDSREQVDLGLFKNFGVLGNTVVLRLDVFNIFDRVTWGVPVNDFANVNFGRITSTHPDYIPRTFQVGLRLLY